MVPSVSGGGTYLAVTEEKMILSVSRRTDVPNYYADWFFNRIKEGFVCVRNPMNPHQVSRITLSSDVIDCIVFWTKNPVPMLARLDEISAYSYYFQYTLTGYGRDVECNLPNKKEVLIPTFQSLAEKIGSNRVVWRYDPILFNKVYTPEYHRKAFRQIAEALNGYTEQCVISFVDTYAKNKASMKALGTYELPEPELFEFTRALYEMAKANGIRVVSCAEQIDLSQCGVEHSSCVDKARIEDILGCSIKVSQDKNQRTECGCVESVDIGTYNTCKAGCKYCYANHSAESVMRNAEKYDVHSPLLCGAISAEDRVSERRVVSVKQEQLSFLQGV